MKKISDIFKEKERTFSIELFPPKTEEGYKNLLNTISQLSELEPDFISCTYGAGGGNRSKTLDIAQHIQEAYKIPSLAHLTCVLHTKREIKNIIDDIQGREICNILALRGDFPSDSSDVQLPAESFKYAKDLCDFIKGKYSNICIGVAGFPEGHVDCSNINLDAQYLKDKVDNGADFVITQLFFDNSLYFKYVDRLRNFGLKIRILPGILPITNYQGLLKFTALCGTTVPKEVKDIFEPIAEDKDATLKAGIDFAIKQCNGLLDGGAPGLHFYSLNKLNPTKEIFAAVKK